MLIKKNGVTRDIAESRLHEYKDKGYAPCTAEETPIATVSNTDTSPKKQGKKAKE